MKINVDFDTQTKELVATMNGEKIENLSSIYFYTYDGNGSVELTTVEQNKDEGMIKVSRVMAEEKDELVVKEKPVHQEIAELFMKK